MDIISLVAMQYSMGVKPNVEQLKGLKFNPPKSTANKKVDGIEGGKSSWISPDSSAATSSSNFNPVGQLRKGLTVNNSLSPKPVPFVTKESNTLRIYVCGPTVYNPSHLGHARSYLTFDIIRRILEDYFGYNIFFVMNITDIDDKIIKESQTSGKPHLEVSSYWEKDYWQDMTSLGIRRPDVITRVTEYVPEIIEYVQGIIKNGYGYESNGSVYFDVDKYSKSPLHQYRKLAPPPADGKTLAELVAEGEGSLSAPGSSDKRNPNDFALWKASKEGEPKWESPWGQGRPGWHIECSAMASDLLGDVLDIHGGGVDLRFPHHDNEIAQAEAYYESGQWCNFWFHAGHLHIKGLKMSKSLKNFVTIKQSLEWYTANQLRFLFLVHQWDGPMDYSDNSMEEAVNIEKIFSEFFLNLQALEKEQAAVSGFSLRQNWRPKEKQLNESYMETKTRVDAALRDNFNTPVVIQLLQELIKATNVYLGATSTPKTRPLKPENDNSARFLLLKSIAVYITHIFRIFGLVSSTSSEYGFGETSGASGDRATIVTPFVEKLMELRDKVRTAAKNDADGGKAAVLAASDWVRDIALPDLGVRLEDAAGGKTVVKLEDPKKLELERKRKETELAKKAAAKAEKERIAAEKAQRAKIAPVDYFKTTQPKEFASYDEEGLPLTNAKGEELTKSSRKKLKKEYDAHKKLHEKFLKTKK